MIVRKSENGDVLLVNQTDHSRLAGQFAAHWGNDRFAKPDPFESVARAATFHDFGYLRYETAPVFDPATGTTPNFRDVVTDERRLQEYQWCFDWLLEADPYAGLLVNMHRTGLWRGRYDAIKHPPHKLRTQPAAVDAFTERNEAARKQAITEHGWDEQRLRINYRLLQVWDLLSLYFSCQEPAAEDYIEPVPISYSEREGEGVRLTLKPTGKNKIAIDPYPFDANPCVFQLTARRLSSETFADKDAFYRAYFQAQVISLEYELSGSLIPAHA
jgi:hypothetical protein